MRSAGHSMGNSQAINGENLSHGPHDPGTGETTEVTGRAEVMFHFQTGSLA